MKGLLNYLVKQNVVFILIVCAILLLVGYLLPIPWIITVPSILFVVSLDILIFRQFNNKLIEDVAKPRFDKLKVQVLDMNIHTQDIPSIRLSQNSNTTISDTSRMTTSLTKQVVTFSDGIELHLSLPLYETLKVGDSVMLTIARNTRKIVAFEANNKTFIGDEIFAKDG